MDPRARTTAIGVLLALAWLSVLAGFAIKDLASKAPLDDYGEVTEAEARELGERVAAGFSERDSTPFDEALDAEALSRLVLQDSWTTRRQRAALAKALREGTPGEPGLGGAMVASLAPGTRVTVLRSRVVGGQRRVLLRLLPEAGVNYLELMLARDGSGKPRIVDFYNYMAGEPAHVSMRAIGQATSTTRSHPIVERVRRALGGEPRESADPQQTGQSLTRVRELTAAGNNAAALEAWEQLPQALRATRAAMVLRLVIAQRLGGAVYQETIEDIEARFPGEPGVAFMLLDAHFLRKDWPRILAAVDDIDRGVGGDPYLAVLRTTALLELGRAAEAKALLAEAISREGDLPQLWWTAVNVSLRVGDHAETARLLDELALRFDLVFEDLTTVPEYERFVRSREYRAWSARLARRQARAE